MKILLLISALALVFFTSCDPSIQYEYKVNNTSQKTLVVLKSNQWWGIGLSPESDSLLVPDSIPVPFDTIFVYPHTEVLLMENDARGSNPHDEKDDFLNMMAPFLILSTDSSKLNIDYYKREYWAYDADIGHLLFIKIGTNIYTLQISDDDF